MKQLLMIICTLSLFFVSCKKSAINLTSPENQEFAKNTDELKAVIQTVITQKNKEEKVIDITKIEYFGTKLNMKALIQYSTNLNQGNDILIERTYNSNGELVKEITLNCKGTCAGGARCGLKHQMGSDLFECNCTECTMEVSLTERSPIQDKLKVGYDAEEFAKKSYLETFQKEGVNVQISKVTINETDKASYTVFEYSDKFGNKSTFMIFEAKVTGLSADGTPLPLNKKVEIDCTGSCSCTEQYIPSTGTIQCSCQPCTMKVTTIE
jgi:hypothetical protein